MSFKKVLQLVSDLIGALGGYLFVGMIPEAGPMMGVLGFSLFSVVFETGVWVRALQGTILFLGMMSALTPLFDPTSAMPWLTNICGWTLVVLNLAQVLEKALHYIGDFVKFLRDSSPA